MKDKGFLDDIEKLVEDFSKEEKKQINTRVNYKTDFAAWFSEAASREDIYKVHEFQRRYLEQTYTGGWSTTTTPKNKEVIECRCGVQIEIFFIQGEIMGPDHYDWTRRTREVIREVDNFRCPRCAEGYRIVGKITELKVKMTE